jgi:hypothetical protein
VTTPFEIAASPATQQASGAILNGKRFIKVAGDPEDKHSLGEQGIIVGSIRPALWEECGYFVRFDDTPDSAVVFIRGYKIREASPS